MKRIHKVVSFAIKLQYYNIPSTIIPFLKVIPGARQPEQPRTVVLKLWKTGFSLDEGPVRDYQNPTNKDFLEYIKRG